MSTSEPPSSELPPPSPPTQRAAAHLLKASQSFNYPSPTVVRTVLRTVPYRALLIQVVWTSAVIAASYFIARSDFDTSPVPSTLGTTFWTASRLNLPPSLSFGIGWSLFTLLSFFLREATAQHRDAHLTLMRLSYSLRRVIRILRHNFPRHTWHHNDHDRIIAHLVAVPLSFYDLLDQEALKLILHPADFQDIVQALIPHAHCTKVVRAYFTAAEPEGPAFRSIDAYAKSPTHSSPAGTTTRAGSSAMIDEIDNIATALQRLRLFRPAFSYVNHLSVFLYIWLGFMPISLIESSGWFTIVWSLLVTYAVVMVFNIAYTLNKPFGQAGGPNDELRSLLAGVAYEVLLDGTVSRIDSEDLLPLHLQQTDDDDASDSDRPRSVSEKPADEERHFTPKWLTNPLRLMAPTTSTTSLISPNNSQLVAAIKSKFSDPRRRRVYYALVVFTLWTVGVTLTTYFLRVDTPPRGARWWYVYLPIDSAAPSYVSTILSALFGFWLTDVYGQHRAALELWTTQVGPLLRAFAFQLPVIVTHSSLHKDDVERFLSHIVALPYTLKSVLRMSSPPIGELDAILSPNDVNNIKNAREPTTYILSVISAYLDNFDKKFMNRGDAILQTYGSAIFSLQLQLPRLEEAVLGLLASKLCPVPVNLQTHLIAVAAIWLVLIPFNFVLHDGWLSVIYLVPSAYCVLYLVRVGIQLDTPFGNDYDDLPMDEICEETKRAVHGTYDFTILQPRESSVFRHTIPYDRRTFEPSLLSTGTFSSPSDTSAYTNRANRKRWRLVRTIVKKIISKFPSLPPAALCVAFAWNLIAVVGSYGLSKLWDDDRQDECRKWCSPVDVDGVVLASLGLTLFVILSFRSSDAVSRYDQGARTLRTVCATITAIAADLVQTFPDGKFHASDKERIVAHLVQIPLSLRDALLADVTLESPPSYASSLPFRSSTSLDDHKKFDGKSDEPSSESLNNQSEFAIPFEQTLLKGDDIRKQEASSQCQKECSVEAYLNIVEAYFTTIQIPAKVDNNGDEGGSIVPFNMTFTLMARVYALRESIATLLTMKHHPFPRGYSTHQQVFIAFWLALLPLSMTPQTGFMAIIPSTLICAGVLAFEEIASRLVDPFDTSNRRGMMDGISSHYVSIVKSKVPVTDLCEKAAADILEAVQNTAWDTHAAVHPSSKPIPEPTLGVKFGLDGSVTPRYVIASCKPDDDENGPNNSTGRKSFVNVDPENQKSRKKGQPGVISHILYSIPWGQVQSVTAWTTLACVLSFITRDQSKDGEVRWWVSFLSIAPSATIYLSFLTFNLLGFYVNTAYNRYAAASRIWQCDLTWVLHSLAAQLRLYWKENAIHSGDHERVLGHLAALPYALRSDLRYSKDLREAKGLLSPEDYSAATQAENMSVYILSVVRSYFIQVAMRPDIIGDNPDIRPGRVNLTFRIDVIELEQTVQNALHYRDFDIAPQFTSLLDVWLYLWFFLLPFILAEISGWLSIAWALVIAVAVLGLRQIAREIVHPYGYDVNDLDLNKYARAIVADVLSAYYASRLPSETPHLSSIEEQPLAPSATRSPTSSVSLSSSIQMSMNNADSATTENDIAPPFVARRRLSRKQLKLASQAISWRVLFAITAWSSLVVTCAYFISKKLPLPDGNGPCLPWFCSALAVNSRSKEFLGFALFIILGFRMSDSHRRYVDAVRIWNDDLFNRSYLFFTRYCQAFKRDSIHPNDHSRVGAHILIYISGVLSRVRESSSLELPFFSSDDPNSNRNVMDVSYIIENSEPGYWAESAIDVIRGYLVQMQTQPFSGNEMTRIFLYLRSLASSARDLAVVRVVQLPVGYVLHLQAFTAIWCMILPFSLVERTGWLAIFWSVIISYAILGVAHWAEELADPFGEDISDIPLRSFAKRVAHIVKQQNDGSATEVDLVDLIDIGNRRPAFQESGDLSGAKTDD